MCGAGVGDVGLLWGCKQSHKSLCSRMKDDKQSFPLDHVKLDAVINRVSSHWKRSPNIVTMESFSGFPVEIFEATHEQETELFEIVVVQHGDKVYFPELKSEYGRSLFITLCCLLYWQFFKCNIR